MAQYDRMRAAGLPHLDAMTAAAPFFARPPRARTGGPAPARPVLEAGSGLAAASPAGYQDPRAGLAAAAAAADQERAERRGREIAARLQARSRAAGRGDLARDELAMILESVTTLPADVITRIAAACSRPGPDRRRPGDLVSAGRSAARLSADSFPFSAAEAARSSGSPPGARPPAGRTAARRHARRPGR